MNDIDYKSLLKEDEWKAKCMKIIQRDNCICQDCHKIGIHNSTYFPIHKIEDIEIYFSNIQFNEKKLSHFCEECNWSKNIRQPIRFSYKQIEKDLYFYTIFPYTILDSYNFIADRKIDELHFYKATNDEITIHYNNKKMKGRMFAFCFKEEIANTNYASIKYQCGGNTGLLETIEIHIHNNNKLYYFYFTYCDFIEKIPIFNFRPLHIHHKYYIKGQKPWEYKDEVLITLCADCHQKKHSTSSISLYSNEMQIIKSHLPVCERCNGKGFIPQYHYHYGGICFKCNGEGVYDYI